MLFTGASLTGLTVMFSEEVVELWSPLAVSVAVAITLSAMVPLKFGGGRIDRVDLSQSVMSTRLPLSSDASKELPLLSVRMAPDGMLPKSGRASCRERG